MSRILFLFGLFARVASQTAPSIEANGRNILLSVPEDAAVSVQYVSQSGAVVRTAAVATSEHIDSLRAELTEWAQIKIDALNASKADVALTAVIQTEVEEALRAIGRVELTANASSAVDQGQAECHNLGDLFNITSGQCQRLVSCGDAIWSTVALGARISDTCGARHFYRDECDAACPPGYTGDVATLVCGLEGEWRPRPGTQPIPCGQVNECAATATSLNTCQQNCADTEGSFICSCRSGFTLDDNAQDCTALQMQDQDFVHNTVSPNALQTYTIPRGVSRVRVRLWGSGGESVTGIPAGSGAYVEATLPADQGVVWTIAVGGPGTGIGIMDQNVITSGYGAEGGGLVGIFNTTVPRQGSAVVVAGSGGANGGNKCTRGGHGGGTQYSAAMDGQILPGYSDECTGKGGNSSHGGAGGGATAGGRGAAGGALRGGAFGSYGSGGGVGFWGGGGGGHCPNVCGGGGGGGTSYFVGTAADTIVIVGGGSPSNIAGRIVISAIP